MIRPLLLALALSCAAISAHAAAPAPKPSVEQLEAENAQLRQQARAWQAMAGAYKAQRDEANDRVANLAARIDLAAAAPPPPAPPPAAKKP